METKEPEDNHRHNLVLFERSFLEFVLRAISFYISLLSDEEAELSSDHDLSVLISDKAQHEFGLTRNKEKADRIKNWLKEELDKRGDPWSISLSLDHWLVKFMKSVGLLYVAKLKQSRNNLASRSNLTASTLSSVDREISAKEELLKNAGVFKEASTLTLLASYGGAAATGTSKKVESDESTSLLMASRPRPVLIGSIEILDHELRNRCLDLFNQFQESGQSDRNDTVVSEAARILENRLRSVVNCEDGKSAKRLVSLAFNPENPILVVSEVRAEQEAAQLLFLGTFGFIRNQVQHKLLGNMSAERVLQILGWIDYLLSVMSQSTTQSNSP